MYNVELAKMRIVLTGTSRLQKFFSDINLKSSFVDLRSFRRLK